jgi:hypothetical protein
VVVKRLVVVLGILSLSSACSNETYDDCILEHTGKQPVSEVREACRRKFEEPKNTKLKITLPKGVALGDVIVHNETEDIITEYELVFPDGKTLRSTSWIDPYDSVALPLSIGIGSRAESRFPGFRESVAAGEVHAKA